MKRKPIRIDWDGLEDAFDRRSADLSYYLDLITGHVKLDVEEDDADDDQEYEPAKPVPQRIPQDGTRAYIEPLTSEQKLDWVDEFLDEADDLDATFVDEVQHALGEDNATDAVVEVLNRYPEGKDRWFAYRAERLHELIEDWLAANEVDHTNPPPWEE